MAGRIRSHLTYANVVASIALFAALGGGAYAAATLAPNSVGSKQLKKKAVTNSKLGANAVTSSKVKNGSLLKADFAAGQLPGAGAAGPAGPAGSPGAKGDKGDKGDTGLAGPLVDTLPSGKTLRGAYGGAAWYSTAAGIPLEASISYAFRLASNVAAEYVNAGAPSTAHCPGTSTAPAAAAGFLCIYAGGNGGGNNNGTLSSYGTDGVDEYRFGAIVYANNTCAEPCYEEMWGTWAVTAP